MQVDLIDHMGTDLTVVNAARVSFHKESEWESIGVWDVLKQSDQKLIKYLATHGHWTPFSHVMIQMREKVPIFVARQRFKHMVGFTYNEVSRRYVDDEPTFFEPLEWRKRAENKKQGSSSEILKNEDETWANKYLEYVHDAAIMSYRELLKIGVAPEQARMVLPQSMYTEYYVTGSLAAWARAYKQRIDDHAQKEIQDLASLWNEHIQSISEIKHSWEALIA